MLSCYRIIVLSYCRVVVSRIIMLSRYCGIVLLCYHSIMLSCCRALVLSCYRVIVLSRYHVIVLPCIMLSHYRVYHVILLSYYRIIRYGGSTLLPEVSVTEKPPLDHCH